MRELLIVADPVAETHTISFDNKYDKREFSQAIVQNGEQNHSSAVVNAALTAVGVQVVGVVVVKLLLKDASNETDAVEYNE